MGRFNHSNYFFSELGTRMAPIMIVLSMKSRKPDNPDEIKLFSIDTSLGRFEITTPSATFNMTSVHTDCVYSLTLSSVPDFRVLHNSPYVAIRSVSEHRSSFPQWDKSREAVSDYSLDWTNHLDKLFRMRLLGNYLDAFPDSSYRDLVDYFELRHSYVFDRIELAELLRELIVTGQLAQPLQDCMTPSELKDVAALAKSWK